METFIAPVSAEAVLMALLYTHTQKQAMKEVDKIKLNENKINWLHHAGCRVVQSKRRKVKFLCETKCAATYESATLWNILAIKHDYVPYCPGWRKYANGFWWAFITANPFDPFKGII